MNQSLPTLEESAASASAAPTGAQSLGGTAEQNLAQSQPAEQVATSGPATQSSVQQRDTAREQDPLWSHPQDVWGGDTVDVRDATTGKVETREGWELPLESGRGPDGAEIARRVILTPFALALDFVTIVAQAWLFGTDEDLE